jgi:hypothetical protein
MKTTFVAEFASAAKEGPKLFFGPLVALFKVARKALHAAWRRVVSLRRVKQDIQKPCEGK